MFGYSFVSDAAPPARAWLRIRIIVDGAHASASCLAPLDQKSFDQIALTLDREPRHGRRDPRRMKTRPSGFIEPHGDAEPVKLFERRCGHAPGRDRKFGRLIHRNQTVRPLTDVAQLGFCPGHRYSLPGTARRWNCRADSACSALGLLVAYRLVRGLVVRFVLVGVAHRSPHRLAQIRVPSLLPQ
jgi:hypothetical protein